MSLASRTVSAVSWITVSTVSRASLQLAQLAVLARLLSPQDFGLMAIVAVVSSYAALFSDVGLSTAFVQRQQISREERSSLYWFTVLSGGGLMLAVMALSPLVARFFREPHLVPLISLVATNFLVVALGQQLRIDAEKSLNFRPVALIDISVAIVSFLAAVLAAWIGWGVYALVVSSMVASWLTMLLQWSFLANGWRPSRRLRWKEVHWFVKFGSGMVINNIINHVSSTADLLIGGRMLGAGELGIYSVPRNLILQVQGMVNPVFTRVGFPLIASMQHDRNRVKQVYLKTMNLTCTVNAPLHVALGVYAPEVTSLLLGERWSGATQLLRIIAIWGLLRSFGNPAGTLLFGLGQVRLAIWWNLGLLAAVGPSLWLGSHWGPIGMAWSMVGVMAVSFVPGWAILVRPTCGAEFWIYSRQMLVPTTCALLAGLISWVTVSGLTAHWMRLGIGLVSGLVAYLLLCWLCNRESVKMTVSLMKASSNSITKVHT